MRSSLKNQTKTKPRAFQDGSAGRHLPAKSDKPKFNPWSPCGRRRPTPTSCALLKHARTCGVQMLACPHGILTRRPGGWPGGVFPFSGERSQCLKVSNWPRLSQVVSDSLDRHRDSVQIHPAPIQDGGEWLVSVP